MHCTLLIADLLLPHAFGSDLYRDVPATALKTVLARGRVELQRPLSADEWLCRAFGLVQQQDYPIAPLLAAADGIATAHDYWLVAQPVHLRADGGRLRLAVTDLAIAAEEAHALLAALNAHFGDTGLHFTASGAGRWYVHTAIAPQLATTPLIQIGNHDIDAHMPRGADALRWHKIMNEAQMIMHSHAVNQTREARALPPVNSIWFWGGGIAPATGTPEYTCVWSADETALALAAAVNIERHPVPAGAAEWLSSATPGHHLITLDGPAAAIRSGDIAAWHRQFADLERDWLAPLLGALRAGKLAQVALALCNRENLIAATITRPQSKRWWRRSRQLGSYARTA